MVGILAANSLVSTAPHEVSNSLRFNRSDSAYLTRTPSSAGNRKTFTFSAWFKHSNLTDRTFVLSGGQNNQYQNDFGIEWANGSSANTLVVYDYNVTHLITSASYRDVSAWYHLVVAVDTTQSTDSNRIKVYINGEQITNFSTSNYPSQNDDTGINSAYAQYIGTSHGNLTYGGYIAETYLIDGTAKAHTDFGEFNDNGVWIPKKYSGSYGTNGFKLEFKQTGTSQNASGIGADTSGNGNHFAVNNLAATDVTTDTCTNNFCTLNSTRGAIGSNSSNTPLFEGNLKALHTDNAYKQSEGTIFPTSGKWYWETLITNSGNDAGALGIVTSGQPTGAYPGTTINGYGYDSYGSGSKIHNNSRDNSYGSSYAADDIIGTALDLDNGTLTFYKNNSSQGQAYSGIDASLGWGFGQGSYYATNGIVVNFGQEGSFAGNKTAQGNADGNDFGDFYYSPPSGYFALCTKNLAEYG